MLLVNVEPGTEQDRRDLWKVRVRTIRQDEVDNKDSILHDKQQQILEKSVKSSLEKAGVDTGSKHETRHKPLQTCPFISNIFFLTKITYLFR